MVEALGRGHSTLEGACAIAELLVEKIHHAGALAFDFASALALLLLGVAQLLNSRVVDRTRMRESRAVANSGGAKSGASSSTVKVATRTRARPAVDSGDCKNLHAKRCSESKSIVDPTTVGEVE